MPKRTETRSLILMDAGSASAIARRVEGEVGCGNTMDMPNESGFLDFFQYGVFCKDMFAFSQEDSSNAEAQCVVMGGCPEGCPRFGNTLTGESSGLHDKLKALRELQTYVSDNLVRSRFNYSFLKKAK